MRAYGYILVVVLFLFSCKKEEPGFGMTTLKHFENDSLYSYIQIPNAFTPDGDGINEYFLPFTRDIDEPSYELKIFNTSGAVVFTTTQLSLGWDGTHKESRAAAGKYFYHLIAKDFTGFEYDHQGELYYVR